jgi:exopolysaccharide biosynthesis polyprenyl glycosylphosphotransferase
MISHRTSGMHSLLVITQIAFALILYALLIPIFHVWRALANLERYTLYGGVIAAALFIELLRRDRIIIRTCIFERSLIKLHGIALKQIFWVFGALVLFVTLLKDATLSRVFLATYLIILYALLLATNRWLPRWIAVNIFRGKHEHRTLLVGSKVKVPLLRAWLERKASFGFRTIGILCGEKTSTPFDELEVLGVPEDIQRVIREYQISQVIVLGLPVFSNLYYHLTHVCNRHGVRMMILSDLEERLQHPAIHVEDDGLQFIAPRQEPLENPLNRILKRLLDIAISLNVIVFILPVIAIIVWIIQRIQSRGPLFYRQTRAGIQNLPFNIIKFRTMQNENNEAGIQATKNDNRVYPFGRLLRKYSVDELPQFLNVLFGDMSVVGPRPHLMEHNDKFAELLANYQIRAFVRPGITGLAQVRGFRGEATTTEAIASRLEADTYYLENWSLAVDLGIILRTVWHVIRPPKTAY